MKRKCTSIDYVFFGTSILIFLGFAMFVLGKPATKEGMADNLDTTFHNNFLKMNNLIESIKAVSSDYDQQSVTPDNSVDVVENSGMLVHILMSNEYFFSNSLPNIGYYKSKSLASLRKEMDETVIITVISEVIDYQQKCVDVALNETYQDTMDKYKDKITTTISYMG